MSMKLIADDFYIPTQVPLIRLFGDNKAKFLCLLHQWQENERSNGKIWRDLKFTYNPAWKWAEQIGCSERTIQRIIKFFKDKGILLVEKLNSCKWIKTNYFYLCLDKLRELISPSQKAIKNKISEGMSPANPTNLGYDTVTQPVTSPCRNLYTYDTSTHNTLLIYNEFEKIEEDSEEDLEPEPLEPTEIDNNMLLFWNKTFEKSQTDMTEELSKSLISAYYKRFNASLDAWYAYLELISTSKYLMGEKFNLTIEWALQCNTIERLCRGDLGVVKKPKIIVRDEESVLKMIDQLQEEPVISMLRKHIAQKIGFDKYYSWFHVNAIFELEDGQIKMIAPNDFVREYWEIHFGDLMKNFALCKPL